MGILKQRERVLIKLLNEELNNIERKLEKVGEKTKQVLEDKKKQKWRKFKGITESSRTRILQCSKCLKFLDRQKRKLIATTIDSQPEVNQEKEVAVTLEPKNNYYNVSQNSTQSTLPKRISPKDANSDSYVLMANNSANPDIVLKDTANQRQEDMKQHSIHEKNKIENGEGN